MKSPPQRILVTGASGLLGCHLLPRLDGKYEVIAVSRHPTLVQGLQSVRSLTIDISDPGQFEKFLSGTQFDIAINCAAYTDVDGSETDHESAYNVNTQAADILARFCADKKRLLLHLSTDYVFNGKAGPYSEEAITDPINYYGFTKLQAERAIKAAGPEFIIVRTCLVYGKGPGGASKLVRWILDSATEGKPISAAVDLFQNPTWAGNLADALVALIAADFRGIINVGGADYLSRYDFAIAAAKTFGIDASLIKESTLAEMGGQAPRPPRAGLIVAKMKERLHVDPIGVDQGLKKIQNGIT